MTISLDPRVFGSPFVTWTGLTAVVLLALALFVVVYRAPAFGVSRTDAYAASARVLLWGLVGARLLHVLDYAGYYGQAPFQALYVWNGGFAVWGVILGACVGALWHGRRHAELIRRVGDAVVVPALLGLGLFRLVDFLTGQRSGQPTGAPWGVVYNHPGSGAYLPGVTQHPVAAYEMVLVLIAATVLWGIARSGHFRRWPTGMLVLIGLVAYAVIRFAVGFARVDPAHLGLNQAQWMALAVLLGLGTIGVWWRRRAAAAAAREESREQRREEHPVT